MDRAGLTQMSRRGAIEERLNRAGLIQMAREWRRWREGEQGRPVPDVQRRAVFMHGEDGDCGQQPS